MHLCSKAAILLVSVIGFYGCNDTETSTDTLGGADEALTGPPACDGPQGHGDDHSDSDHGDGDDHNGDHDDGDDHHGDNGGFPADGPTTTNTPIGLAFEIDNGVAVPLKVRKGQRLYINQIDMRASLDATTDEGVAGLDATGDFASINWNGISQVDQSFVDAQNADGTFTRRRFYRNAHWMNVSTTFSIDQLDVQGHTVGDSVTVKTGLADQRNPSDDFFIRRMRAIQWTYDCSTATTCDGATHFNEEALIELRNARSTEDDFKLNSKTTALRVTWSGKPGTHYKIPVEQIEHPNWDYGFGIDLAALTPPAADGTYQAGQQITFQFTLKDGSGKRLHDPGVMPSYSDFLAGNIESGIQYYRAPLEPTATYYRRKHREKQLLLEMSGPVQNDKPIYSVVDILQNIDFTTGVVTAAFPATDGIFGAVTGIPSFLVIFGGPPFWSLPSTDTWTFTVPPDAAPGTYKVVIKGRRAYLGEDIPRAKVLEIQVGTPTHTTTTLTTGGCENCHNGGGSFKRVLHGLDDRGACTACHAPLSIEREGPIYVRAHFIHSRSGRFDEPLDRCKTCHLAQASIQRTSKSACLSCHKSYPDDHVQNYGPITDMYVGGGDESFQQCSTTCHTTHPHSGF